MEAPANGTVAFLAGEERALLLRMGEIEKYEDRFGGIYALMDRFAGDGVFPDSREVLAILRLGMIGAGETPQTAQDVIDGIETGELLMCAAAAQKLVMAAMTPHREGTPKAGDDDDPKGPGTD